MNNPCDNQDPNILKALYRQDKELFWANIPQQMDRLHNTDMIAFLASDILSLPLDEQEKELQLVWNWVSNVGNVFLMSCAFQDTLALFFDEAQKQHKMEFADLFEETFCTHFNVKDSGGREAFSERKVQFYTSMMMPHNNTLETLEKWYKEETIGYADCMRVVRQLAYHCPSFVSAVLTQEEGVVFWEALEDPTHFIKDSLKSGDDKFSPLLGACPPHHPLWEKWQTGLTSFLHMVLNRHHDCVGVFSTDEINKGSWGLVSQWMTHLSPLSLARSFLNKPQAFEAYMMGSTHERKEEVFCHLVASNSSLLNEMPSFQQWGISHALLESSSQKPSALVRKM